jgi:hypothetical protein
MKRIFLVRAAAALGMAAALIGTAGITADAQAATTSTATAHATVSHATATHLFAFPVRSSRGPAVTCPYPSHDFCVFSNVGCTTREYLVPTSFHSKWYSFSAADVPYHPQCVLNGSNSSVWVKDKATGFAGCAPPAEGLSSSNEQFGYFYVKYNVHSCGREPS